MSRPIGKFERSGRFTLSVGLSRLGIVGPNNATMGDGRKMATAFLGQSHASLGRRRRDDLRDRRRYQRKQSAVRRTARPGLVLERNKISFQSGTFGMRVAFSVAWETEVQSFTNDRFEVLELRRGLFRRNKSGRRFSSGSSSLHHRGKTGMR
jgi:hypothetical protein